MRRYRRVLSVPGAWWAFVAAFVARLPISMAPLGIVLLVQQQYGSYAQAGSVTAAFTAGSAVATPAWGRLIDRLGIVWVLGPLGLVSSALLATLALAAVRTPSIGVLLGLAAAVGATFPPIGSTTRGTWRVLLRDPGDLHTAYALDGVVVETVFVAGPLLLSLMLGVASPVIPLVVTALILALGCSAYVIAPAVRRWRPTAPDAAGRRGVSPLRAHGVLAALGVALVIALAFGHLDVILAAIANLVLGDAAKVGLLFGGIAGGSAVGGTVYGARHWPGLEERRVPFVLAGFALGVGALSVGLRSGMTQLTWLVPLMFATGCAIAPGLIMIANLVDRHAADDRLSEAQAWLTTAYTSGSAAGTAIAGFAVDRAGISWALGEAALGLAAAAVLATLAQPFWRAAASD